MLFSENRWLKDGWGWLVNDMEKRYERLNQLTDTGRSLDYQGGSPRVLLQKKTVRDSR